FAECNLDDLQAAIEAGAVDASAKIDAAALVTGGVVRRALDGVRLLGRGELKSKVQLELAGASASAVKAVEAVGGSITLLKPAKPEANEDDSKKAKKAAKKKS
ncbi:MAG TPA: uL15m family ribosomal protein, partial [Hyphomicrobiales bacterium]|nr:uL15m family ribosomal protein [Hyphomicrobiales bacterium]